MPASQEIVSKKVLEAFVSVVPVIVYIIKVPYWALLQLILIVWGRRGIHSISIGQFKSGTTKKRSLFREEMLLKTIVLFCKLRDKTCLDIACNDGFWSFRLSRFGLKSVTGIDGKKENVYKANFLKNIYDYPKFQFKYQDLFEFLYKDRPKSYDLILLLGIIYHLPEETDWERFFEALAAINNECLVIDSRWFEDDDYWYIKNGGQAVLKTENGIIQKWRPTREHVVKNLYKSGYQKVVEINPSAFLLNQKEAFGNGDPYTYENVSDYLTDNRSLIIAYKQKTVESDTLNNLTIKHANSWHQ